jgi:hypothetical protein
VSEVLIVAGGFEAGRSWAAAAATALLALGFLGLAHALIETTSGKSHRRDSALAPGLRGVMVLTTVSVALLAGLALAGVWLPGSELVQALTKGIS